MWGGVGLCYVSSKKDFFGKLSSDFYFQSFLNYKDRPVFYSHSDKNIKSKMCQIRKKSNTSQWKSNFHLGFPFPFPSRRI